jgi:hypothetical protein
MGACCGKASSDAFDSPGRVLGTAPPQPKTAAVPAVKKAATVGHPPQTLGGGGEGGPASGDVEARRRAAEAAEVRETSPHFSLSQKT